MSTGNNKSVEREASLYKQASELIKATDIIAFRKLIRELKNAAYADIIEWRKEYEADSNPDWPQYGKKGIEIFSRLISIALLGASSGLHGFRNQIGLLDDIINPSDWKTQGRVDLLEFPLSIGFIYQALLGSLYLLTDQMSLANSLAESHVVALRNFQVRENPSLWKNSQITVCPPFFPNENEAAKALKGLYNSWLWIENLFGDIDHFEGAICAYYGFLNIKDYCDHLTKGNESGMIPRTSMNHFLARDEIQRRGYAILIRDPASLQKVSQLSGITAIAFAASWGAWIRACRNSLSGTRLWSSGSFFHENLARDLNN